MTTWLGVGGDGFFGPIYSDKNSVGMIIGTGNVGPFLNLQSENINTYFSRDAGLSWFELMKGSTIYEYGDFGGLLVLAPNNVITENIYYSLDGGVTFGVVQLGEVVIIVNIITSSTKNERFIVISKNPDTSAPKYWGLDFSHLHERNCSDSDYEDWQPTDGLRGAKCVLGHDITYRRRKRTAACYTNDNIDRIVLREDCVCKEMSDYECDFKFEMTVNTGKCVYVGTNLIQDSEALFCTAPGQVVNISSGYRKVPGDTCVIDIKKYAPIPHTCSDQFNQPLKPAGISTWAVIGVIVVITVVVIAAAAVGFMFGLRDERFRQRFPWIKAPSWVTAGYSNTLVDDELGDEFGRSLAENASGEEEDEKSLPVDSGTEDSDI